MAGVGAANVTGGSGDSGNRGDGASDAIPGPSTIICTKCGTSKPIAMFYGKRGNIVKNCRACRDRKDAARRQEVASHLPLRRAAQLTVTLFPACPREPAATKPRSFSLSVVNPFKFSSSRPSQIVVTIATAARDTQAVPSSSCNYAQPATRSSSSPSHAFGSRGNSR